MHILAIHDNDQDGYCAANVLRKYHEKAKDTFEMTDITSEVDWANCPADKVYFLDHTPSISLINDLLAAGKEVSIVDHHEETYTQFSEMDDQSLAWSTNNLRLVYSAENSTAKQVWHMLHGDKTAPYVVTMVDKWDIWNHDEDTVIPFHFGLSCMDLTDTSMWDALLSGKKDAGMAAAQLTQMGSAIGQYWLATMNDMVEPTCWAKEKNGTRYAVTNAQLKSTYDMMAFMQKHNCTGAVWFWKDPESTTWTVAIKTLPKTDADKATSRKEVLTYDQLKDSWF